MADISLNNTASTSGLYNDISTGLESSVVVTLIADGLRIEKTADQEVWASGNLTYTVTITNDAESDYVSPVLTDILDPTIVTLVEGSVMVDGVAATDYTFDAATGTLIVNLPTVASGSSAVVTFQVQRV